MKPPRFEYVAPRSLDEAVDALAAADGDGKVLAGGQSLVPLLNFRLASPSRLVDLNHVRELAYIQERDGGLAIGAMTRDRAAERDARVARLVPMLAEAIRWVGHPAIRNRGTVGGSIAHGDPAGELPAVAVCLDARLTIRGPRGERRLGADALYLGYLATALEPDEILTEVWFPAIPPNTGHAWLEFARRHGDFAIAGAVVGVRVGDDARVDRCAIALFGVGDTPVRAAAAEAAVVGRAGDLATNEIGLLATEHLDDVPADIHATAWYRKRVAAEMVSRALTAALEEVTGG